MARDQETVHVKARSPVMDGCLIAFGFFIVFPLAIIGCSLAGCAGCAWGGINAIKETTPAPQIKTHQTEQPSLPSVASVPPTIQQVIKPVRPLEQFPSIFQTSSAVYSNVVWLRYSPSTVTVRYEQGVETIPIANLPDNLQHDFGYQKVNP